MVGWRADSYLYLTTPWLALAGRFFSGLARGLVSLYLLLAGIVPHVFLGFGTLLVVFITCHFLSYCSMASSFYFRRQRCVLFPHFSLLLSMFAFTMLACLSFFTLRHPSPARFFHASFSLACCRTVYQYHISSHRHHPPFPFAICALVST